MMPDSHLRRRYADLLGSETDDTDLIDLVTDLDALCTGAPLPAALDQTPYPARSLASQNGHLPLESATAAENPSKTQTAGEKLVLNVPDHPSKISPSRARRNTERRWWHGAVAVAAVILISVFAQFVFGHRFVIPGVTPTQTPAASDENVLINQVSMDSVNDGWAIGSRVLDNHFPYTIQVKLYHYHNGVWVSISLESFNITNTGDSGGGYFTLNGISIDAPDDGWAFVSASSTGTLSVQQGAVALFHYDGSTWARFPLPDPQGVPRAIQMSAQNDGWLETYDSETIQLFHYDGHNWLPQRLDAGSAKLNAPGLLDTGNTTAGVDMRSANEGWVYISFSDTNSPNTSIYHYIDNKWSLAYTIPLVEIRQIDFVSDVEAWAIGYDDSGKPYLYHLQDGSWNKVSLHPIFSADPGHQIQVLFTALQMYRSNEGWIFGYINDAPLLLRYDGQKWEEVPMSDLKIPQSSTIFVTSVSLPTPDEGWAVGVLSPSAQPSSLSDRRPLFLHYHNGVWSVYNNP